MVAAADVNRNMQTVAIVYNVSYYFNQFQHCNNQLTKLIKTFLQI